MSVFTTLTRAYLTRSFKPFEFKNEYDEKLSFFDADNLGLYVHIPFCRSICPFCPYCKQPYTKEECDEYVDSLLKEIRLVCSDMNEKKRATSLYFGGGTPALAYDRIKEIIQELEKYFIIEDGIGLELHPSDVTKEKLSVLKEAGVTKISIGIQSFSDKFLKILKRTKTDYAPMFEAINKVKFETVSMDFIFALPDQTADDVKRDIETAFSNGANHVAVYPFINFTFTKDETPPMKNGEKKKLLYEITDWCESMGYKRDSIWTFSNDEAAKYSSMTRDNFLGFGCSATTLLKDQFKINTFSVKEYKKRTDERKLPTSLTLRFSKRQRMVYYLFWTAYSTYISEENFKKFFGESLNKYYGTEFFVARALGFIKREKDGFRLTKRGAFYFHYYENFYTLSYIDKMWGIKRQNAFPEEIKF